MRKVRRYFQLIVAAIIIMMPILSPAQGMERKTPAERAEGQTKWMRKNLNLSADQLTQVEQINLKYAQMNDKLGGMNGGQKGDRMRMRKENQDNKDAEMKAVLNSDQYQKYQSKEAEIKEKMRERMQNKMNDNNTENMNNSGDINNR